MADQAQGLRDLVKAGGLESMGLPKVFDQSLALDKAKLWDDLKSELEREAIGPAERQSLRYKTIGGFGPNRARAMVERMLQMETFARVKTDMAVKG